MHKYLFCIFIFLFSFLAQAEIIFTSKDAKNPFQVEVLAKNLGVPWGMVFLNPDEMLFTERKGHIKKLSIKTGQIITIKGALKIYYGGQGGLLDLALDPHFKKNKIIYLTHSIKKGMKQSTALSKGVLKNNEIINLKTIFVAKPFVFSQIHFGSRIGFNKQGFLFMSVGDRGKKMQAQNLSSHLGKVLRLDKNGRAARGNPFSKLKPAQAEIWSLGHRNPQGLFIHPQTGQLWLQEHGPKGGDEINLVQKGKNYGWPIITYGKSYAGFKIGEGIQSKKGLKQPVHYWVPSIAPSGLMIYSGKKFPHWRGDFFSGALALTHLNKLKIKNNKVRDEKRFLSDLFFRFRNVIEGKDGLIYASTDQGMILRIRP